MSRWAERLKSKYANAEIAEIAKTPAESLLEGSFGNIGNIGTGISAETDPGEWAGECEPARGRAIRYRRHGELFNAPRLAIVPPEAGEHLFDVADWLDGQGLGPVAIIEAAPAPAREPATDHGDESEHDAWLAGTPAAELGGER